jgi:hypothetical protein
MGGSKLTVVKPSTFEVAASHVVSQMLAVELISRAAYHR